MFLKFFLSFNDEKQGFSVRNRRQTNKAADTHVILPARNQTTFGFIIGKIASMMYKPTKFLFSNYSREILVNLSDESMFQLEALCIKEYCYCTYNLETKNIGFGNSMSEAYSASVGDNKYGVTIAGGSFGQKPDYMIQFYKDDVEPDEMSFTCPDGFYEQVLNQLKPYIVYEKNFLFKKCTDVIASESYFLSQFICNYYVQNPQTPIVYNGIHLSTEEFKYTITMFMEDDPDIFQYKDEYEDRFQTLGDLCFKIMQITDETF